ncbi:MAG: hypothetical protein HC904_08160 [Blastochloris sp.]|nr:hypothetical protein [Blastochloris sp.]
MLPQVMIVGPTGSGKSELALDLAQSLGAELASMDAFQIYRGMDIGTGKVPEGERRGLRHHLMDLVECTETFSVGDYLERAAGVLSGMTRPLVWVGGTGLYYRSLRQGLSDIPARIARWWKF